MHLFIVQLNRPVMAQGNVEQWLGALLKEALHSVHLVIKNASIAIEDPNFDMVEFLDVQPAQVNNKRRQQERIAVGNNL